MYTFKDTIVQRNCFKVKTNQFKKKLYLNNDQSTQLYDELNPFQFQYSILRIYFMRKSKYKSTENFYFKLIFLDKINEIRIVFNNSRSCKLYDFQTIFFISTLWGYFHRYFSLTKRIWSRYYHTSRPITKILRLWCQTVDAC